MMVRYSPSLRRNYPDQVLRVVLRRTLSPKGSPSSCYVIEGKIQHRQAKVNGFLVLHPPGRKKGHSKNKILFLREPRLDYPHDIAYTSIIESSKRWLDWLVQMEKMKGENK